MPVLVVADVHLDFWLGSKRDPFEAVEQSFWASLDALIIAGDLANKPRKRWKPLIQHIGRYVDLDRVYVFPGNHDYYDHLLNGDERLAEICAETGANFAQKAEIVVGDTRFLTCTLWTDFVLFGDPVGGMRAAQQDMNDYRYIRISPGYRRIRPSDTALIHTDHRNWLEEKLAVPYAGQTIVVTHHCPHPDLVSETRGDVDPAYGSNLLPLIEKYQPDCWLYGHTHHHVETDVGRTQVRNVSLGYPGQVPPDDVVRIIRRGLVHTRSSSEAPS